MVDRVCACGCGNTFKARVADVKRGWGKYYSKSCKAVAQERRTGQYKAYNKRPLHNPLDDVIMSDHDSNITIIYDENHNDTHWEDDY